MRTIILAAALIVAALTAAVALPAFADASATGGGDNGETGIVAAREAPTDLREAELAHARCMREQGINFPDPKFGEGGSITIEIGPEHGVDPSSKAFRDANAACGHLSEKARQNMPQPDPEHLEAMREHALEFAQCMREQGLDWPDPQFDDGGFTVMLPPQGMSAEDLRIREATEACEGALPAPLPGELATCAAPLPRTDEVRPR
jgi:hypothetical protein